MRYALLSDAHGRITQLEAVLADARIRGAGQIVCLGDVGGDACVGLLRRSRAKAVFGNYEVSGWQRLAAANRAWVQSWPPLLSDDGFLAVHAAPWWPRGLMTIDDFGRWLRKPGRSWRSLFPYLSEDENHLWEVLAELESTGKKILFHGHTHRQAIWRFSEPKAMEPVEGRAIEVDPAHHYIVGVGSVGLPEDGGWAAYTLYDAQTGRIELIRLEEPSRRFA